MTGQSLPLPLQRLHLGLAWALSPCPGPCRCRGGGEAGPGAGSLCPGQHSTSLETQSALTSRARWQQAARTMRLCSSPRLPPTTLEPGPAREAEPSRGPLSTHRGCLPLPKVGAEAREPLSARPLLPGLNHVPHSHGLTRDRLNVHTSLLLLHVQPPSSWVGDGRWTELSSHQRRGQERLLFGV